jgi:pyruvate-formate lyase-activating enzyme
MKMPVHRIIPFSNVEGLGNRTSIFVQGCNANCLYCHNSETIPMTSDDTHLYSVDELIEVIKGYQPFIRGITVSGGEATIYHKFLTQLFKRVHELGLTCYVDTNGFFDRDVLKDLINQTDKFLFDIKGIGMSLETLCFSDFLHDKKTLVNAHKQRFSVQNEHFLNLSELISLKKIEEVRLVYIKGYFDEKAIVEKLADILKNHPEVAFKIIRVHGRGLPKERMLKLKGFVPSKSEFDQLEAYCKSLGILNLIKIY